MTTRETPVARVAHRCCLCQRWIAIGEQYIYCRYTPWDHSENDDFFTYKAHVHCDTVFSQVGEEWNWEFPPADVFRELLKQAAVEELT